MIQESSECLQLVEEARLYHLLPDRRSDFGHSERLMHRRNAGSSQVVVSVGGEDDKVINQRQFNLLPNFPPVNGVTLK